MQLTTSLSTGAFRKIIVVGTGAIFATMICFASHAGSMPKDIVDTAISTGSFSTHAATLSEAGLVETLKGDGQFIVFVPTDEAFAKLPKDQLEVILADKELLASILPSAKVVTADVEASNGVIHVIDTVLVPQSLF